MPTETGSLRVGFTVGKVLGGAVERNRIKRRMREAVRLSWPACERPMDVVFNPRKSGFAVAVRANWQTKSNAA